MQLQKSDYSKIDRYWGTLEPTTLAVYSMEKFGFPQSAGALRFSKEQRILSGLISSVPADSVVLDLGSGIGSWTVFFSERFRKVTSVEYSESLYRGLEKMTGHLGNVVTRNQNAIDYVPEKAFDLIFLGGLLTCLHREEVFRLLCGLKRSLNPGGVIVCRESTISHGVAVSNDDRYEVIYRAVSEYERLFSECELVVEDIAVNTPYVFFEMLSEPIEKWRAAIPSALLPAVGHLLYALSRPGYNILPGWVMRQSARWGIDFPKLKNHFFRVRPSNQ